MKLIPQERLDAAKGHTPGPWVHDDSDVFTEYGATTARGVVAAKHSRWQIADCGKGVTVDTDMMYRTLKPDEQRDNAALCTLAPELLAENEMLRALLTEAMNVNADITTHAHHLHSTGLLWRAEKIKELADALSNKLDEVLP